MESRYATTGKTTASAHSDPSGGDRHRKGRNSIGGKPIRATHSTASHHAAGDAAQETHDKAAEEEKARQEEKERAIQKVIILAGLACVVLLSRATLCGLPYAMHSIRCLQSHPDCCLPPCRPLPRLLPTMNSAK